ncbi:hypothetical protein [Paenibacillus terrigena]|uniref:hypothetical protein n=1 Tax=Paenibacillus terrigena TaxID=369333 RepID=UPI0003646BE0|nr:hypothetical protein [Paenibacillus terrigena]
MNIISGAVDVGGIRASLEVDISGYNVGIDKAKQKVQELGAQGKKAADDFKEIETALNDVGSAKDKIGKLTSTLDNVNAKIELQRAKLAALKQSYDSAFNDDRKTKLQGQILSTEASLNHLIDTSDKIAKKIWDIDESAVITGGDLKKLTTQLKELGLSDAEVAKVDHALKNANPEILRGQIAEVTAEMKRLGLSSHEIDKVTQELTQVQREGEKTKTSISGMESALMALGGTAAIKSLISEMRELVAESERMYNATKGLIEVSKNLGYNVGEATSAVQDMTKKGFMNATEAAQAYKTALAMGLDIKQTTELINAMGDAAAYNRQAHYGWGESIVVAMEGIKNGNSTLTDSVGVTKNLSVMQEEYAKSIGTTSGKLTDAQKVQAAYNGFLKESQIFAGNASAAMADYAGTVAKYDVAMQTLEAGVGDAIKPIFAELLETITPIIQAIAEWVVENKTLVSGLVGAAATVAGLVGAFTVLVGVLGTINTILPILKVGFTALGLSMGPVGIAIGVLGAIVGGLAAYTAHARNAVKAAEEMSDAQRKLNDQLDKSPTLRNANDLKQLQSQEKELTGILEERAKVQERLNEIDAMGKSGESSPHLMVEAVKLNDQLKEIDKQLKTLGHGSSDEAAVNLRKMREEIEKSSVAMFEMNKEEYDALAAKRSHSAEIDTLMDRYKKLNAESKLTNEQNNQLKETINDLKKEYPDLTWEIDAQGRARITNIGVIDDQIGAEKKLLDASTNSATSQINNLIAVTAANKKAIEAQINNYMQLIKVMSAAASQSTQFGPLADPAAQGFTDKLANKATERFEKELQAKKDEQAVLIEKEKEMQRSLQNLKSGEFINVDKGGGGGGKSKGAKKSGKSAAEIAKDLRKKAYDADIATINYQAEMYDWSAEQQIAAYEKVRANHKQHLKETLDDERTLNLQIKRLNEDTAKSRYDFSSEWIAKEQRRLEDAGKSEEDVAKTKLDAWTRLRDRYGKDTEFYKKADEQVYQARKQLVKAQFDGSSSWVDAESRRMEEAGKSEAEIERMKFEAWARIRNRYDKDTEYYVKADEKLYQSKKRLIALETKLADELTKKQKVNVDEAKKAELAAIEERKKAYEADYKSRIDAIDRLMAKEAELNSDADYETKLAEKRARLALLQSAVGPDGIKEREDIEKEIERMQLEHDRDIRKRELESQKQAIQDEKSQRDDAFAREKSDVEAKYDALKSAFDSFSGDVKSIESAIADFRVKSNVETNAQILSDLDSFVAQYNAKMSSIQSVGAGVNPDLTEYNANKDAWASAKARGDKTEMARLNARNEELRKLYGISSDTGKLPSFDVGGVVPGAVGQPMQAIIHGGEAIFNQRQLASLFALLDAPITGSSGRFERSVPVTEITNHIDMSVNDVVLEDRADIETMYSERERVATRLRSTGVKTA